MPKIKRSHANTIIIIILTDTMEIYIIYIHVLYTYFATHQLYFLKFFAYRILYFPTSKCARRVRDSQL